MATAIAITPITTVNPGELRRHNRLKRFHQMNILCLLQQVTRFHQFSGVLLVLGLPLTADVLPTVSSRS
ncbi:hypothetical protein DBP19_22000 [Streptomyces sp. CS090A]|nr:hypothetical protein DBP19_22000 [Streptomyces sp. CS090A]